MKKAIFSMFLSLSALTVFSQEKSSDIAYLDIDDYKIENFKDVYIENFSFKNPTIAPDLGANIFQPDTMYNKLGANGKIKKVTKYVQFSSTAEKQAHSYTLYNNDGLVTQENQEGYINIYYGYDNKNRLINRTRVVRNDTVFSNNYEYNDKGQLIKFSGSSVVYDTLNRPVAIKNSAADGSSYNIIYNNNVVMVEELYNKRSVSKQYVYSKNYNVIKEVFGNHTVFNSYSSQGKLIKKVTFINNKLNSVQSFEYNANGHLQGHTFQFAIDIAKGTKAENKTEYLYDSLHNKVYEKTSGDITKNTTEYYYEIEYYE